LPSEMPDTYDLPRKNGFKRRLTLSNIPSLFILAASIAALYYAREICIPLAFALTLTLLLTPASNRLQRLHVPRVPAVLIVILAMIGAAGGIGWVIANQLVDVANELPKYRENIHNKIAALRTPGKGALARAAESVKEIRKEFSGPDGVAPAAAPTDLPFRRRAAQSSGPVQVQVVEPPANGLHSARELVEPFLGPLGKTLIVLVFTVFLMVEREDLRNRLLRLAGLGQLNVMTQALDDATQRISRYLLLQFIVNASFGFLFWIGLTLIGVPYAALWGAVAALFRVVPYVGTMIAAVLPLTLSLAVSEGWAKPSLVFGLFASLELVVANVIEPWLYGSHTGISSLAILVSTVFWTILWGPAGLILSTPLTVCVAVLGRYVPQLSFLHILLGDEPVLEAEAQLYQRLLAMDQVEARAVADRCLKERSLVELYDSVMIPALTMAEQDRHKGALDPVREEFLYLSIGEMIAESAGTAAKREVAPREPAESSGRVLCIPANDTADEITAAMLAQLLEESGFAVVAFPVAPLRELLPAIQPEAGDVICISALPPFALGRARALCRQFRTRFPQIQLVVGIWGLTGSPDDALNRFERFRPDKLETSLASMVSYLNGRAEALHPNEQAVEAVT
jgi:predicted PurR-regulated permease PerM